MKTLLFSLLFSLSISIVAQNWSLFSTNETYHFNASNIHSVRVDSSSSDPNSTLFYFNKIINDTVYDNYYSFQPTSLNSIHKPNLFGDVVHEKNDSVFFTNLHGQAILFLCSRDSNWTFYQDANYTFEADVDSVYSDVINGQTDSLRKIMITAYDNNNVQVNNILDHREIIISKDNGFIKTFNFYQFPENKTARYYGGEYNRIFEDVLKTRAEMFDFNVNDVYHLGENHYKSSMGYPVSTGFSNHKILSKNYSTTRDTVFYTKAVERDKYTYSLTPTSPPTLVTNHQYINDTANLYFTRLTEPFISTLPKQTEEYPINATSNILEAKEYKYSIDDFNGRLVITHKETFYLDSITGIWMFQGINYSRKTIEGVCAFTDYDGMYGGNNIERRWKDLIYFNKGSEVYGTPRIVVSVEENFERNRNSAFKLYPNPAKNQLYVEFETNSSSKPYTIFSIDGKVINSDVLTNQGFINISNLPNGIYFMQFGDDENREVKKFIIQR